MAVLYDGTVRAGIVIAPDAPEQAKYAASQLRHYLGLMTGGSFAVTHGVPGDHDIGLLGSDVSLGDDGFTIDANAEGIRITGNKRGILYGVYELLERLGCRFFAIDCEVVPLHHTLTVPDMRVRQVPALEYREHNYSDLTQNTMFAVKSRVNGQSHKISEAMGGHISYAWFVHTFDHMVPQEKYEKSHPEYYALVDGKRQTQKHTGQLCLSQEGTLEATIQSVREALHNNPDAKMISLSQNDWNGNNCQCADCVASDNKEGSPAGTLTNFVNKVAERLETEFPQVVFSTLAYQYTRPAPKYAKPRHNVSVQLCSIECCFAHPMETCDDQNRRVKRPDGSAGTFMDDLVDWGKVSRRNFIWDYTTCFAHYPTPHPNWRSLQPNMRAFVKNGVTGVFEQGNGAKGGGTDLNELRAYVIAKLLWDKDTDVARHIREFTDAYYGDAAPMVRAYIDLICDKAEQDNIHVGFNDEPSDELFSDEMLDRMEALLQKGKEAVRGDAIRLFRVDKALLSPRYVRIRRNVKRGRGDVRVLNAFYSDWRAHRMTRMEEWFSGESSLRSMLDGKPRSVDYFTHWIDESPEVL